MTEQLSHFLLKRMHTDDIVERFHSHNLFTDDDIEVISFTPSEYLKNRLLLENLQYLKLNSWLMICDIMENDVFLKHIGSQLRNGKLFIS